MLVAATSARADPGLTRALEEFAKALGLAYQIHDDVLDETARPETLGKTKAPTGGVATPRPSACAATARGRPAPEPGLRPSKSSVREPTNFAVSRAAWWSRRTERAHLAVLMATSMRAEPGVIRAVAKALRLACQIHDDVLDETARPETLGKPHGADRRRGKPTFVSLLGVDGARRMADRHLGRACDLIEEFGTRANELRRLARRMVERTH